MRLGQSRAQEVRALRVRLGVGVDRLDRAQLPRALGDQAGVDRVDVLADDRDVLRLDRECVERGVDGALQGVLDRHEGTLGLALLHGYDAVVDRWQRDEVVVGGCAVGGVEQRLVRVRALGAEVGDPHQAVSSGTAASAGAGGRGRLRGGGGALSSARRTASCSSGDSSNSPTPASTRFAYRRACSRWMIEDSTTPLRRASSSAIEVDWWPDISP